MGALRSFELKTFSKRTGACDRHTPCVRVPPAGHRTMTAVTPTVPPAVQLSNEGEGAATTPDATSTPSSSSSSSSTASYEMMRACTDPLLAPALNEALDVMGSTFRLYPANSIWQSWNGACQHLRLLR